jgi:hypothetical protein
VVVQQDLAAMNEPVLLMASFVVVQQDLASWHKWILCGSDLCSWVTDTWDRVCMLVTVNYHRGSSSLLTRKGDNTLEEQIDKARRGKKEIE